MKKLNHLTLAGFSISERRKVELWTNLRVSKTKRNLVFSICALMSTTNVVMSGDVITSGILTCTPVQQNEKPIVFLFNEQNLVRDDKRYWILDKLGTIQNQYYVFAGLTPSQGFIEDMKDYQSYSDLISSGQKVVDDVKSYIGGFTGYCDMFSFNGVGQGSYRDGHYGDNDFHKYLIKNVPYIYGLNCANIKNYYSNGELRAIEPVLTENDYYITKVTIDTTEWSVISEIFFKSFSPADEPDFQNVNGNFASSFNRCQVIQLDKVEIDENERIIELPGSKL